MAAHRRDELGLSEATAARPLQAALASALTFSIGAALPLLVVLLLPAGNLTIGVVATSLAALAVLGFLGARAGGAPVPRSVMRVVRSEEHTSELQSLMRISYAVFCLKKKKQTP